MAITYAANVFSVDATSANDESTLKAVVDANPTVAWYEGGACTFRAASLNFASNSVLTIRDGTNLVFGGGAGYRINGVDSILPILDFKNGGGIVYNGNVQHSFFRMDLRGNNITYRVNANTAGGRGDFFVGGGGYGLMTGSMKDLTLVMGNGASNWTYYIHLELLAGKINGLKIINDLRTSLGGGNINLQFGNGAYQSVTLPAITSGYGISATLNVYLARSGGNARLVAPSIPGSSLTIVGDTTGTAELVNEVWPDMAAGAVGAITASTPNSNNTAVSRKITWTPGTYYAGGWNVDLRDSKATPTVYKNGLMTAATDIEMTWALYNRNPSAQTLYTPFKLVARKRGFLEQTKTFSPVQAVVEAFVPDTDTYYTSDQSALAGISASASTLTITTTSAFVGTVDQMNDWFDWWLEQPTQLVSVPATPKSNSGTTTTYTGWTLSNAGTINSGTKLKAMVFATITNTSTITALYTSGTSPSARLTLPNLTASSIYVADNSAAQYDFKSNQTGSVVEYFAPGKTGTWVWVAERYGYKRQVGTFTPGAGGDFAAAITWAADAGLIVTNSATVAAYTSLDNPNMVYDYAAYWRTTNTGITVDKLVKDGAVLRFGDANVYFSNTATAPLAYNASTNTFTIKSTTFSAGSVMTSFATTGAVTVESGTTIGISYTDSSGTRVFLTNRNGVPMTSYVLINGTPVGGASVGGSVIPGFVPLVASRALTVQASDTVRMVVNAYGYKPQVINCTGANLDSFTVSLEIESGVDITGVSTATRDTVAGIIGFVQASPTQIDITLLQTLADYYPKDCVAGIAYAFVSKGYLAFAAMAAANSANIYSLSNGQMVTYLPGFKLRMANTDGLSAAIVPTATGYSVPLVAYYYNTSTGVASPVTVLNASNAKIETAPWTQTTATLSEADKASIVNAVPSKVWTEPTRTLTTSGGVTLAEIEASTVLAKEATSASIKAKTDTLPTLAQVEASTVLAKEATAQVVLTKADEVHKIHGLDASAPLNVTTTSRTAGAINQTLTGDGVAITTVTRV